MPRRRWPDPDPSLWDADGVYRGATPGPPWPEPLPMDQFDVERRERISALVKAPKPPPPTVDLGLAIIPSRAWAEWHWARGLPAVPERRAKVSPGLRAAVYERDGHRCVACGATEDLTLDHVFPWSLGGEDKEENFQTLCRVCNSSKGAQI